MSNVLAYRLYRAKDLPSRNGTYGDTVFYSGQTSYHNMKVLSYICRKLNHC